MDHFVRFEMRFLETYLYTLQIIPASVTVFPYHNRLREFSTSIYDVLYSNSSEERYHQKSKNELIQEITLHLHVYSFIFTRCHLSSKLRSRASFFFIVILIQALLFFFSWVVSSFLASFLSLSLYTFFSYVLGQWKAHHYYKLCSNNLRQYVTILWINILKAMSKKPWYVSFALYLLRLLNVVLFQLWKYSQQTRQFWNPSYQQ